jgi:tRNA pseudouridine55 synthase
MPVLPDDFDSKKGAVFLIDKPLGWTSFDVVNKVRYALGRGQKVGHAGTLDPLASGLLVLCCGAMTKQIEKIQSEHKVYQGTIQLGATTPTYDRESPIENHKEFSHLKPEEIEATSQKFVGKIEQIPPAYSAVLIEGKRAYELARKGQNPKLSPRQIEVFELKILSIELPMLSFKMKCSKGTYVRSFAHDLGQELGCGAFLASLQRTQSGDFCLEQAWQIDDLVAAIKAHKKNKANSI